MTKIEQLNELRKVVKMSQDVEAYGYFAVVARFSELSVALWSSNGGILHDTHNTELFDAVDDIDFSKVKLAKVTSVDERKFWHLITATPNPRKYLALVNKQAPRVRTSIGNLYASIRRVSVNISPDHEGCMRFEDGVLYTKPISQLYNGLGEFEAAISDLSVVEKHFVCRELNTFLLALVRFSNGTGLAACGMIAINGQAVLTNVEPIDTELNFSDEIICALAEADNESFREFYACNFHDLPLQELLKLDPVEVTSVAVEQGLTDEVRAMRSLRAIAYSNRYKATTMEFGDTTTTTVNGISVAGYGVGRIDREINAYTVPLYQTVGVGIATFTSYALLVAILENRLPKWITYIYSDDEIVSLVEWANSVKVTLA